MKIDRCICFGITFAELRDISVEQQATTCEQLREHVDFADNCRFCEPYVREMLNSGTVVFTQAIGDSVGPVRD